jgi:hypothetical protein
MYSKQSIWCRKTTSSAENIRKQHNFSAGERLDDLQKMVHSKLGIFSGVLVTSVGVNGEVMVTALLLEEDCALFLLGDGDRSLCLPRDGDRGTCVFSGDGDYCLSTGNRAEHVIWKSDACYK